MLFHRTAPGFDRHILAYQRVAAAIEHPPVVARQPGARNAAITGGREIAGASRAAEQEVVRSEDVNSNDTAVFNYKSLGRRGKILTRWGQLHQHNLQNLDVRLSHG